MAESDYIFEEPIDNKRTYKYEKDFNENSNENYGLDYQYLYRNMNFFGEIAKSKNGGS